MKYKPNMSPEEQARLLSECDALDQAHQDAAAFDEAQRLARPGVSAEDEAEEDEAEFLRRAGLDRRGRP